MASVDDAKHKAKAQKGQDSYIPVLAGGVARLGIHQFADSADVEVLCHQWNLPEKSKEINPFQVRSGVPWPYHHMHTR